ncbi:MAG: glycosyltransferase family 2 protein [Mycoplasma sp.]|nr:glycosyltransferase family 2 protein [Candidatus Hennigella equi]
MQKTLTIVVCCYNSAKTILNTLNSIDIKSNKDIDVFLIDDGSKDNLKEIVKDYLKDYPDRVHYFRKENGNWGSCINFAIANANSRFLSVLDSDDTYNTKSLGSLLEILRSARPETDMVFCNYEFHFINERSAKIKPVLVSRTNDLIKYKSYKHLSLFHIITIHSAIFSLDILKTINPLPSRVYYSDNVLIYQALLRARNVAYVNRNLFLYQYYIRQGNQSISIERSLKNFHHFEIIFEQLLKQPFIKGDRKRLRISKRCITMHMYWLMRILVNDYSRDISARCDMLKNYILQYEETVENNHCSKFLFHSFVTRLMKYTPRFAMWVTRVALAMVKSGFIKATDYSKENKKEAHAFAKAQRKAWRQQRRERRKAARANRTKTI